MSEKRFYHSALEKSLLSGRAQKRRIKAAIAAQSDTVRQKKDTIRQNTTRSTKEWNPRPIPWIALPVAAMLLLTVLAGAITAGAMGLYKPTQKAATDAPVVTAPPKAQAAPELNLTDLGSTVVLLPDFSEELQRECLDWRERQHGAPYKVEEWEWLKDVKPEVIGVAYNGKEFSWNVKTTLPQLEPFMMNLGDAYDGQLVELSCPDNVYISVNDSERTPLTNPVNARNASFSTSSWFESGTYYTEAALPASGTVTVTERFYLVDFRIEDMQRYFGAVAYIEHSFSFNAAALTDQPGHYAIAYQNETTEYRIDADVDDLPGTTFETFEVQKTEITNEMLASFVRCFAGDAPLYDDLNDTRYTKAQLDRLIKALKDGKSEGGEYSDKEIESLEAMYPTALESYADRNKIDPAWNNYHGDPMFQALFEKDGAWYYVSGSGSVYQSYLQCSLKYDDDRSRLYASEDADAPAPKLTEAEAIEKADAIKNALAPSLRLDDVTVLANVDLTGSAYRLLYRPACNDFIAHETRYIHGSMARELTPAESFTGDRLWITVDEQGVVSVSWATPCTIIGALRAAPRITVDAILSDYDKPFRYHLFEKFPASETQYQNCTVHIDRIALEYAIVTETMGDEVVYRMKPVWNFYGDITNNALAYEKLPPELCGGDNNVLLSFDAISGDVLTDGLWAK